LDYQVNNKNQQPGLLIFTGLLPGRSFTGCNYFVAVTFLFFINGNTITSNKTIKLVMIWDALCAVTFAEVAFPFANKLGQSSVINMTDITSRGVKFKSVFMILFLKFL
jgi:hypothetical protein